MLKEKINCSVCDTGFYITSGSRVNACPSCVSDLEHVNVFNGSCGYADNDNIDTIEFISMGQNT